MRWRLRTTQPDPEPAPEPNPVLERDLERDRVIQRAHAAWAQGLIQHRARAHTYVWPRP